VAPVISPAVNLKLGRRGLSATALSVLTGLLKRIVTIPPAKTYH